MKELLASFFATLTFNQAIILIIVFFAMVIISIIVLAKNFRIEKISVKGIEFDTDETPKTKRRIVRKDTVAKK